ncbi:hypothetical protein L0156_12075 [bacterium]|nr:hypothetical protein [bacterium]
MIGCKSVKQFTLVGRNAISKHHLDQPYVRQFTIGVDRVLPGNVPFGVITFIVDGETIWKMSGNPFMNQFHSLILYQERQSPCTI